MNDLYSLLPSWRWSVDVAPLQLVGEKVPIPESFGNFKWQGPTLIALGRHCGCPFIEKEVRQLCQLSNENKDLQVVVVCMSNEADGNTWFKRVGGEEFNDVSRVKLVCDETRATYGKFGFGYLSFSQLFGGQMWKELFKLKEAGIVNTETMAGSNRYQNSGGIAVDGNGYARYVKLAVHAGDTVDYSEAVKTIL